MADEKPPQTKVDVAERTPGDKTSPASEEAELISLDELDKLIDQNDPDFHKNISQVTEVKDISSANIELLDLDKILAEEKLQKVSFRIALARRLLFLNGMIGFIKRLFLRALKEGLPFLIKQTKNFLGVVQKKITATLSAFKYLSVSKKLAIVGITLLSIFLGLFVYRSLTVGIIPQGNPLFVNSMEEWAKNVSTYSKDSSFEQFYDSPRVKQNIVALRRAVVNLKPSAGSGPNPMAFFEFFVEGNSTDVAVELKDREYEIIDVVQRLMEDNSFAQLDSIEGKQNLLENIRKELNSLLTRGKIRRVYIKQAIIKP